MGIAPNEMCRELRDSHQTVIPGRHCGTATDRILMAVQVAAVDAVAQMHADESTPGMIAAATEGRHVLHGYPFKSIPGVPSVIRNRPIDH